MIASSHSTDPSNSDPTVTGVAVVPQSSGPSYMKNIKGTIRKVRGADPIPVLTPEEQKNADFRSQGFLALRIGYNNRVTRERIAAHQEAARDAARKAREAASQPVLEVPNEST